MIERLLEIVACPPCRVRLQPAQGGLRCPGCGTHYPVTEGVPHLLPTATEGEELVQSGAIRVKESGWVKRAKTLLGVPSPTFETGSLRGQIPRFVHSVPEDGLIANVGSAGLRHGPNVFNLDIAFASGVDLVGDATELPLLDNCLDGIICRRVLEHVRKPGKAVDEFQRVLKPGGRVWCEIPFLQGYHPTPTDFQRYTSAGITDLFDHFEIVETGVALGPSSTVTWILREYLALLFSFNNVYLYKIGERVFSWLTLPVKFLDGYTSRSPFAGQIASSFYVIAEKRAAVPE